LGLFGSGPMGDRPEWGPGGSLKYGVRGGQGYGTGNTFLPGEPAPGTTPGTNL